MDTHKRATPPQERQTRENDTQANGTAKRAAHPREGDIQEGDIAKRAIDSRKTKHIRAGNKFKRRAHTRTRGRHKRNEQTTRWHIREVET